MKKILLFILTILSIFLLVSCKKNEAVARDMNNILSDFEFEHIDNYNQYEEICKEPTTTNKINKLGISYYFMAKTKKKVALKSISYTLYNTSETDSLFFLKVKDPCFIEYEDGSYGINNNKYTPLLEKNFDVVEIKPNEYVDIYLNLLGLTIKKKKELNLFFNFTNDPSLIGGNVKDNINLIKEYAGIANFKVDYTAYMKI